VGDRAFEYDGSGRRVREGERVFRWDAFGHLAAVDDTETTVDAFGELTEVGGAVLMWDTDDPLAPLAWMRDRALVGLGQPWATARADGDVEWLAPDWQGTIGARDAFGAPALPVPGLGYRGELEFAGLVWQRARAYDPATRGFLSPDPLPPVLGTAYAANPYHYAGNDPLGRLDPLGLRPVTDQELRDIRDRMGQSWFQRNADYIVAGALIVGGVVVMATGVGGPIGAAMIGGALLSAGGSAAVQRVTTGHVDYGQVAVAGLIGAGAGVAGLAAGGMVSGTSAAAAIGRGALSGSVESVVGGAATRGITGGNPFDPKSMATDLLLGGGTGAAGGAMGARAANGPGMPYQMGHLPPGTMGTTDFTGKITISHGLSPQDFAETLRHESVHAALTPTKGPFLEARQNLRAAIYQHSQLARYGEEAAAETYATGSLTRGLQFPTHGYGITPGRIGLETAAVGGAVGAAGFGVHEATTR